MNNTCRIGIGGPVGSGKTALIEAITPRLLEMGCKVLIITNDIVTTEDAKHVRKTLKGVLVEDRIIGVETGACPHTAVREDPSMNIAAGDKVPRKDGPGISQSDILVINKTDLAPYVHADLEVMRVDSERMRPGKPFLFTNCMTGEGVDELVGLIRRMALFDPDDRRETAGAEGAAKSETTPQTAAAR